MLTILAAVCAGLCAAFVVLLLTDALKRISVERPAETEELQRIPVFFKMYLPLVSNLKKIIHAEILKNVRKNTGELLISAGLDQSVTEEQFIGIRICWVLTGILFSLLLIAGKQYTSAFLILAIFCFYPGVWLRRVVQRRHLQILKALPNLLDLLTLSVEAGKDFLTALRDILARRPSDALGDEFKRTLHEIQFGKQRQQALRDLSMRVRQQDLTSVLNAVIQADELGVSIGQLLRIQGDQLRAKRFARAETLANEAPVKILFPVVLFIFPSVFIILIAPIASQAMKMLE